MSVVGVLCATSSSVFAETIPTDIDRSQFSQRIEFGVEQAPSGPSLNSFNTMATGESILLRATLTGGPIPLYEYSATGITDPKRFTYVASATTSLFNDNSFIGQSDQALGLAGFDAVATLEAESRSTGYWEAFSNHTITNGSDFFTAYTVDGENY